MFLPMTWWNLIALSGIIELVSLDVFKVKCLSKCEPSSSESLYVVSIRFMIRVLLLRLLFKSALLSFSLRF